MNIIKHEQARVGVSFAHVLGVNVGTVVVLCSSTHGSSTLKS